MAHMHALAGDAKGKTWRIVMHIDVPDTENAVGVNYRAAVVNSGLGGTTAMAEGTGPGQIAAAEKTQIESGEVYEHSIDFKVEGNGDSPAAVQANLRARYAREKSQVLGALQARLKYFGHTEEET